MENEETVEKKEIKFLKYSNIRIGEHTIFAKANFSNNGHIRRDRIAVEVLMSDGLTFKNIIHKPTKGIHITDEEYERGIKLKVKVFKTSPTAPNTMTVLEVLTKKPVELTADSIEKYALAMSFEDKIALVKSLKSNLLKEVA